MEEAEVKPPPQLEKLFQYAMANLTPAQRELCDRYFKTIFSGVSALDDLPRPALIALMLFVEAAFGAYVQSIKEKVVASENQAEIDEALNVKQFFQQAVMPELPEYWERLQKLDAILEADVLFDEIRDDESNERQQ